MKAKPWLQRLLPMTSITADSSDAPAKFSGVMMSSTFLDLREHRQQLANALQMFDLFAVCMEGYQPVPSDDIVSSSLRMVAKSSAYIGILSHRYGQVLDDPRRNPHGLSVSELEYAEARRLGRPTLMFIMSDKHPGTRADFETDPAKGVKLARWRDAAQQTQICIPFDNLTDFTQKAIYSMAGLRQAISEPQSTASAPDSLTPADRIRVAVAPALYAEPPYIGSHVFVGRASQLRMLDRWAGAHDSHPIQLLDAIGGTGKSMLTWHWLTQCASAARSDWAGYLWYSFYEKGAKMNHFCQCAMSYMTGRPLAEFASTKDDQLKRGVLHQLTLRPWLLVLDGLERVLVSYHRFDAAQLRDEDAGDRDALASRDPCDAIRPDDDDFLRALSRVSPSKLLMTSRLTPRALLNRSNQPIPGVQRERLPGLTRDDAEALFRSCGIRGESLPMQDYLVRNCDCHPLVVGVLAGLVNDYLPDRGNFDAWSADTAGGDRLNLAELDLVQRRNHILTVALTALPDAPRRLLSALALLSESADYRLLSALNPHLEALPQPHDPVLARQAEKALAATVRDLESRGLLQYEQVSRTYDLHPVVRGVAAGHLAVDDRERLGQGVVDFFTRKSEDSYSTVTSLLEIQDGLHLVRTLHQIGRTRQACHAYVGPMADALLFKLEAYGDVVALLKPFFSDGWRTPVGALSPSYGGYLSNSAGIALQRLGLHEEAMQAYGSALTFGVQHRSWGNVFVNLLNIAELCHASNLLAAEWRHLNTCGLLAETLEDDAEQLAVAVRFARLLGQLGHVAAGLALCRKHGGARSFRVAAGPHAGELEYEVARLHFLRGTLDAPMLDRAASASTSNRRIVRAVLGLRGQWQLEQGDFAQAADSLSQAAQMAREIGQRDAVAEATLLLARLRDGTLAAARDSIDALALQVPAAHLALAQLWVEIGEPQRALPYALSAHRWAWADGEPYVRRFDLWRALALLKRLGASAPTLPSHHDGGDVRALWEAKLDDAVGGRRRQSRQWPKVLPTRR